MANVIVQRFIGGSQQLQYCSHIQPEKPLTDIISEPFLDDDSTGSFSSVDVIRNFEIKNNFKVSKFL